MMRALPNLLIAMACLLGCSSTGVGNPGVATQPLTISNDSEVEPDATDSGEQLPPENLRQAVLVFGELRFLACDTYASDVVMKGPFVVNLARDRVDPELPEPVVPEGGFCGIDATLAPATQPPAMVGRSMYFSALRSDGTLFMLFADMQGTLRVRPAPGVAWPSEGGPRWFWKLRPRRWLLPSELEAEEVTDTADVNRVVAIDVNRHPTLYYMIRARLARRSTLYVDANDNGQLDPDERLGSAIIGHGLDNID